MSDYAALEKRLGDREVILLDGAIGTQLQAKQKLKGYYGNITEKQFRRLYAEAVRRRGDTIENLIGILEQRLDAVIYRLKFVPTVFSARQFISHGHILVNGKRVTIPSFRVRGVMWSRCAANPVKSRWCWKPWNRRNATCPNIWRLITGKCGARWCACRNSPKYPIRCRWNPIWWSSSIRADCYCQAP